MMPIILPKPKTCTLNDYLSMGLEHLRTLLIVPYMGLTLSQLQMPVVIEALN